MSRTTKKNKVELKSPLCVRGHSLRQLPPVEVVAMKRKLGHATEERQEMKKVKKHQNPSSCVFVGKLPLVIDATMVRKAIDAPVDAPVEWLIDRDTGWYYGSAVVCFESIESASAVVNQAQSGSPPRMKKRILRVDYYAPESVEGGASVRHRVRGERPPLPGAVMTGGRRKN